MNASGQMTGAEFEPGVALDTVLGVLRDGPARWSD